MHYTIYGIKNCNTMKKAFSWLEAHKIAFLFHDYKKEGISTEKLKTWSQQVGWEALINFKGTTWRQLSDDEKKKNPRCGISHLIDAAENKHHKKTPNRKRQGDHPFGL
jgi:Spx/MgsR family transcriptional regulator